MMDEESNNKLCRNAFDAMSMSEDDYANDYWPQLQTAVQQLLMLKPGEYSPVSFEQVYSSVYKCVWNQFSERLFNDLRKFIRSYLQQLFMELCGIQDKDFVIRFEEYLSQYRRSLQQIAIVFTYLNRVYIEVKLQEDLHTLLLKDFTTIVVDPCIGRLIELLGNAQLHPFSLPPSVIASIIRGLHSLKPDFAYLAPDLFAMHIPNILPPMCEADIPGYVSEIRTTQERLVQEGYSRTHTPLKRPLEIEPQIDSSNVC